LVATAQQPLPVLILNSFAYACLQVVVLTDASLEESQRINEVCHSHQPPIPFIRVESRGVFASVFTDFGPAFQVYDVDGR
jgi:ubiquitin-activating enzyme E1